MRSHSLAAVSSFVLATLAAAGAGAQAQTVPVTFGTDPGAAHPRYAQNISYTSKSAPQALQFGAAATASSAAAARTVTIAPGDTVYGIGRRYGVHPSEIIAANRLSAPYELKIGQTLTLPGAPAGEGASPAIAAPAPEAAPALAIPAPQAVPVAATPTRPLPSDTKSQLVERIEPIDQPADKRDRVDAVYTVRPGDTLFSLARKFGISVGELAEANGIGAPYTLSLNQNLIIPAAVPATPAERVVETVPAAPHEPQADAVLVNRAASSRFSWPIKGAVVRSYGTSMDGVRNDGINIAAPVGAPIRAAADGEVVYTGAELAGYGNLLLVKHDDGWVSAYAHTDAILVKKGERVQQGQVVAKVGASGDVDGPQLHFELRHDLKPQDPIAALNGALATAALPASYQ